MNAAVAYAEPSGYTGVDQVNVLAPATLAGKGNVEILLTAGGEQANSVAIAIE